MEAAEKLIPGLLGLAVLLPLLSFWVILAVGRWMGKAGEYAAYVATAAIGAGFLLSAMAAVAWFATMPTHDDASEGGEHGHASAVQMTTADGATADSGEEGEAGDGHAAHPSRVVTGNWYTLAKVGSLELTIGYYIDSLTIIMFCMVTLIASCIHFYAMGYMHDELHDVTDHEVTLASGEHLHRPGRYHRFFQYLSLFCFSMLGLVVAGNIAMTFVFWELVGICSYFLIGFYVERKSASTAANKAFIVNRVGDFGFIIGLMAIWSTIGTFNFGDIETTDADGHKHQVAGIFSQVRPEHYIGDHAHSGNAHGHAEPHALLTPPGMLLSGWSQEVIDTTVEMGADGATAEEIEDAIDEKVEHWQEVELHRRELQAEIRTLSASSNSGDQKRLHEAREELTTLDEENSGNRWAYFLMIVAGVGIFCGCVGKSAQFPLHTWLPDAMEGPTPVSALVHSATMVAAGVFLVARFYPFFLPEVLLVIAITGCITLFMAATIAIVATDIKRVLAYSTVSQLGYMMLALGLGGWMAGVLHLITHAFFKSLLFMCSGSVIHAVHTNEMPEMGGLLKKMPITAYTMLVGCLAIAGMGIPFVIGFSGYYSKDAILEQAYYYGMTNGSWRWLFFLAGAGGATITAFYMFRMWFMTFTGKPRDQHRYDHAHESPKVMTYPLILLAVFAIGVAWPWWGLRDGIESAQHIGTTSEVQGAMIAVTVPSEHTLHDHHSEAHAIVVPRVTMIAFFTALVGIGLAAAFYWKGYANPAEVRDQFRSIYKFLVNKWWFDELYDLVFVKPVMFFSKVIAIFDRRWIDWFIDNTARCVVWFCKMWEWIIDRGWVDGSVNLLAKWTYSFGSSLREVQTGRLRQYVMFIVIATVAIFVILSFFGT